MSFFQLFSTVPNKASPLGRHVRPGSHGARKAVLPGRAAQTLGTASQLTRMKRMSGEEVVAVSQHESPRSNENED